VDEDLTTRHWLDAPPTVGAVLVAHNGVVWLPKVLASFARMVHAPTAWHVVDVSSTDGSAELLRESFGSDRITYAPSGTGFGDAVRLALESLPRTDWIWLLHDDSSVLPDTLSGLLDTATSAPDIGVVGPKIREWPSLLRLLEVGLTITTTGSRETGLETGEPDAGQFDRERDVLAVNTAGMLVRRDVWDEVDGFDRTMPLFFDDVDFGWRVARAGYRTRTAPSAVLFHAEASRRGTRKAAAGDPPHWEQRRAAIYTVLANVSSRQLPFHYVRLFFGSLLRALGFLVGKDPEAASDELLALRAVYVHPVRLAQARKIRAAIVRRPYGVMRRLVAPFWLPYQHGLDTAREAVTALVRPEAVATVGRRSTTLDRAADEAEVHDELPSLLARRPWLAAVLTLVVLSLLAGRGLLGGGLHGGALPPSPGSAGDWWRLLFSGNFDVGQASAALAPAFVMPLAVVASPVWFHPGLVVSAVMLFAVPLAALAAHRFGRQITPHRGPRIVWAVTYGLSVVATGAVVQGRIGTVVALIVLPIIVNTAWQLAEFPGWQLALRLGIWIALASAFAPIMLLLSLGGLLILLYAGGRAMIRHVLTAAGVAVLLLGPWTFQRAFRPWRMWWEAGYPLPGSATVWNVVLGRAAGHPAAPAWLMAALILLAIGALYPRRTRLAVQFAWLVAILGLGVALLGTLVTYSTAAGLADIAPWVGVPVVLWVGGLSTAVLLAVPASFGWPRSVLVGLVLVAVVLPVGTGIWWVGRGESDPLASGRPTVVPVFLAERPGATLVLTGTVVRGVDYQVVTGDGPFLGEEAVSGSAHDISAVVRRILAQGTSSDIEALSAVGVDAIYAPAADADLARRIDSAPHLAPAGSDRPGSRVWTLSLTPHQQRVSTPWWHRFVIGLQLILSGVAVVMTAPVRRRELPSLDDEEIA